MGIGEGRRGAAQGSVRPGRPSGAAGMRLDRRTFLKVLGMSATSLVVADDVLAAATRVTRSSSADALAPADDPIAKLAEALQYDVERIFRFVSDEVRYEPYPGVLRGALGTLWARAGNSADQGLLLAALLDAAVVPHRFAIGRIEAATADRLMDGTEMDLATARGAVAASWAAIGAGSDQPSTPSPSTDIGRRLEAGERTTDEVSAWVRRQIDDNVETIRSALLGAGIAPPGYAVVPDLELEQHVWVQVSSGPGWQDLDASQSGAPRGQALTTATTTVAKLPDAMRHRVQVAVIVETISGNALAQDPILVTDSWADELVGTPIQFLNVRPEGLKALGVGIAQPIAGKKSYLPALIIGAEAYVGGKPFGFGSGSGVFDTSPAPGVARVSEGDATAQWLRMTLDSPGRDAVVVSRPIFDRLDPVARAERAFDPTALAPVDLVDLGPGLESEYPPAHTSHWFTVSGGRLAGDGARAAVRPATDPMAFVDWVHLFHLVRDAADLEFAMPDSVRTFLDAPNVVAFSMASSIGAGEGPIAEFAMDIWHRSYGCLPVAGLPFEPTPGVVAGVLSHVAERLLFGDALSEGGPQATRPLVSVGAVFDAARRDGLGLRTLVAGTTLDGLGYPPEALDTLRRTLGQGWLAIAPERPVLLGDRLRTGWWLVDPITGRTADQMDDGRGEVDAYAVTLRPGQIATESGWFRQMGLCVFGGALLAAGLLDVLVGGDRGGALGVVGQVGGTGVAGFGGYLIKTCA